MAVPADANRTARTRPPGDKMSCVLIQGGDLMLFTPTRPYRAVFRSAVLLLAALALSGMVAGPAAARRPLTETDLFKFIWVADPQISPDGRRVAFVRVTVNAKKDGYDTALCVAATDGSEPPRPFTSGPRDVSPRWSPSGRQLAFLRAKEGGAPQIHLLEATGGGEARAVTDLPGGAGAFAWSPDGRTLAFASETSPKDLERKKAGKKDDEYESDVRVITQSGYRQNGGGYPDPLHPGHLWTVEVPADASAPVPEPRQVTHGDLADGDPIWSPDGATLYFVANRVADPAYGGPHADLYSVPARGGEMVKVIDLGGQVEDAVPSPDGTRLALLGEAHGTPERFYNLPSLFVADRAADRSWSRPRNLTGDLAVDDDLSGDQHAPRGGSSSAAAWSRDQRTLYVGVAERGRTNLKKVDLATGKVTPLTSGDHEVVAFTATPDAARFALVISSPTAIGDIWTLDTASGRLSQLTRFNDPLFAEIDLSPPEELVYKSFDGREIQAWVQKPPGFDPQKKYPLILDIHGGPNAAYGWTFDHEFQWMAAKGYVVLYPNPRGSTSYGLEFANVIQYHYPGDDYQDLMAGVDELVKRGYIDPRRLGVTGGSGGGILTNWIIGHTDRFAAAVSQRSIADWSSFWYTTDFTLFTPRWFRGAPWEAPEDFRALSPITY